MSHENGQIVETLHLGVVHLGQLAILFHTACCASKSCNTKRAERNIFCHNTTRAFSMVR